jgi:hypothetical protein
MNAQAWVELYFAGLAFTCYTIDKCGHRTLWLLAIIAWPAALIVSYCSPRGRL